MRVPALCMLIVTSFGESLSRFMSFEQSLLRLVAIVTTLCDMQCCVPSVAQKTIILTLTPQKVNAIK